MVIVPQVLYPARNIGWSKNQILQLERILSATYRQVLNLRCNFPTELLYLDQNKAGIGLTRLSDIVNKQKIKRMFCMAYGRPFTNIALTAQIDLALKISGKESHPWARTSVDPNARYKQHCSLDSQISWASEENILLTAGGSDMNNKWAEQRICLSNEDFNTKEILMNESAIYYGDIVSKTLNGWKYSVPAGVDLGDLPKIELPKDHRQILRRDQAYLSWDGHNVLEILGLTGNFVVLVRAWTFTGDNTAALADVTDKPIEMNFYDIFPHDCATRYYLSKDFFRNGNIHRRVTRVTAQNAPTRVYKQPSIWEFLTEHKKLFQMGTIYTDGSFTPATLEEDELFNVKPSTGTSASAVVCINSENWGKQDIVAITIEEHTDVHVDKSFTAELIGLLAAHQILQLLGIQQKPDGIVTDCEAAQKVINAKNTRWAGNEQVQLIHAIRRINCMPVGWTRSHPENTHKHDISKYSQNDYGIAIADETCRGGVDRWEEKNLKHAVRNLKVLHYTVSAKDVLTQLLTDCDFAWTKNGVPITQSILSIKNQRRIAEYLDRREGYKGVALEFAAKLSPASGFAERGKRVKTVFDWHYDKRNAAKGIRDVEQRKMASICLLCGGPDSQAHTIECCTHPALNGIRDETDRKVEALIRQLPDTVEVGHIIKRAFLQQINNAKLQLGIWPKRTRKELAKKLNFGALPPQGKKEAKNTLWAINAIYHEGAKELLAKKHAVGMLLADATLGAAPSSQGNSKGKTRTKKLRLTRTERKGYKRLHTKSKRTTQTMTKFLDDLRDIDTLQAHYKAMEVVAQRACNKANAMSKRKFRLISSQDETHSKLIDSHRTKRNKKHKRIIHNNARNVKRTKVHKEIHSYTNTSYLQGG
jgi:hypothetical protein